MLLPLPTLSLEDFAKKPQKRHRERCKETPLRRSALVLGRAPRPVGWGRRILYALLYTLLRNILYVFSDDGAASSLSSPTDFPKNSCPKGAVFSFEGIGALG